MIKSKTLTLKTSSKRQLLDITGEVNAWLADAAGGAGVCLAFAKHTTAALTMQEVAEGTGEDLLEVFEKLIPRIHFRHSHDPSHAPAHMLSSIVGASLTMPVEKGALALGTWQRVLFVELDGPRERTVELRCWT